MRIGATTTSAMMDVGEVTTAMKFSPAGVAAAEEVAVNLMGWVVDLFAVVGGTTYWCTSRARKGPAELIR